MCDGCSEHNHDVDEEQPTIREAVDAAYDKFYDDKRTYVREVATERYDYKDVWEKLRDPERRVIRGSEMPLKAKTKPAAGSQTWGKNLVRPWSDVTQSLQMHYRVLAPEGYGKKHAHQNEAMMYILEGEGYEIHDGKEYKWEAGDLAIIEGGTVHRHYSTDPEELCKGLIIKPKGLYQFLHLLFQGFVENYPTDPAKYPDWTPDEYYSEEGQKYYKDGDDE